MMKRKDYINFVVDSAAFRLGAHPDLVLGGVNNSPAARRVIKQLDRDMMKLLGKTAAKLAKVTEVPSNREFSRLKMGKKPL